MNQELAELRSRRTLIHERVALAREGRNPYVIGRMQTGWLVAGDNQFLRGYCLLLPDPVVFSINDMPEELRLRFSRDVYRAADAILKVTGAYRMNYETLGNYEQALHTHLLPRYLDEPLEKRSTQACRAYDWSKGRAFDAETDRGWVTALRKELAL